MGTEHTVYAHHVTALIRYHAFLVTLQPNVNASARRSASHIFQHIIRMLSPDAFDAQQGSEWWFGFKCLSNLAQLYEEQTN